MTPNFHFLLSIISTTVCYAHIYEFVSVIRKKKRIMIQQIENHMHTVQFVIL